MGTVSRSETSSPSGEASLIPRLAWLYLKFVGITSKSTWLNPQVKETLEKKQTSYINSFWHGRQLLIPWAHRNKGISNLISQSKDGEYIARVVHLSGNLTVRGSSSRGGARALVELKRILDLGRQVAMTPDGPRGPQKTVAPGILYIAQKTGKPILPVSCSVKRKLIFRGWDDYWVPMPFNHFVFCYGQPVQVEKEDSIDAKSVELAGELNSATASADKIFAQVRPLCAPLIFLFYSCGMVLFSPFILLSLFIRYPKSFSAEIFDGLEERLGRVKTDLTPTQPIWIHAASLGECRGAYPLIRALKQKYPERSIYFTSTTVSGIKEARRMQLCPNIALAPMDLPWVMGPFLRKLRPQLLILLESEIWPNWLRFAKGAGARIVIVNGRVSQKSARRYGLVPFWSQPLMEHVDFVCAREKMDGERFGRIGMDRDKIRVTGNLKYDFLPWDLVPEKAGLAAAAPNSPLLVCGSVREGEEKSVLDAYFAARAKKPELRMIFAPRHFENLPKIQKYIFSQNARSRLKTQEGEAEIIIWDSFGDLWQAYAQATLVFIGGSLIPHGGQNPIEPAWFSKPILFGPHMENFQEPAEMLLAKGAALQVKNSRELGETVLTLLEQPARALKLGANAKRAVESFFGQATEKTMEQLAAYL